MAELPRRDAQTRKSLAYCRDGGRRRGNLCRRGTEEHGPVVKVPEMVRVVMFGGAWEDGLTRA